jgi:murein DD-endopeptidase MepM/ murein hydrolase activator NlpD
MGDARTTADERPAGTTGRGRRVCGVRPAAGIAVAGATVLLALLIAGAALGASPPGPVSTMPAEVVSTGGVQPAGYPAPGATGAAADGAAPRAAIKPGSGGWYWPIGTEEFRGWSGWLARRGSYVHVAQDMPCSSGHPVYAIADGAVFISRADAGGYGVGGRPGGCVIIAHTTAAGKAFHALYGHVSGLRVKAGERVTAGQVIAKVNGCRHLHFSVHPGTKYRDRNPYAGHVPKRWADHGGFVDPVKFLKANPRTAEYDPPALPVVEILTGSVPTGYGVADGGAFWVEEGLAGAATYRYDLATGERRALAPGEAVPPFDASRYIVAPLAEPAVGIGVSDRLPVLALGTEHSTPEWGASVKLTATLTSAAGAPLRGALVRLDRLNGERWVEVRVGVTDALGSAALDFVPARRTTVRATFLPPDDQAVRRSYLRARSRTFAVAPHAAVGLPELRPIQKADEQIVVPGSLTPRHPAGANSVDLVFQRRGGAGWVTKLSVDAVNRDAGLRTRYVGSVRLPVAGTWRVQAVHAADERFAQSYSAWRTFTVK